MRSLLPLHLQLAARLLRSPPPVRDDRDAPAQRVVDSTAGLSRGDLELARRAFEHEGMAHAAHRLDLIQVGALDLGVEHRALLEHRVPHPFDLDVDAELLAAHDDTCLVRIDDRSADDLERRLVFQDDRLGIRYRLPRRTVGELAIGERATARRVMHDALGGRAFARRAPPSAAPPRPINMRRPAAPALRNGSQLAGVE